MNHDYTRYLYFDSGSIIGTAHSRIDFVFLRAQKDHAQINANISENVMFHAVSCLSIEAQSYFTSGFTVEL